MHLLLFVLLAAAPEPKAESTPAPDLLVEAWLSTAGPYGESWSYTLTPSGAVTLQVYYLLNPSGSVTGNFHVSEEHVARVRRAVATEGFFELPETLSAEMVALHRPDYRLTITLGGRKAKVSLYDPEQIKGDPRVARFLKVWREMYEGLPLKPAVAAEK